MYGCCMNDGINGMTFTNTFDSLIGSDLASEQYHAATESSTARGSLSARGSLVSAMCSAKDSAALPLFISVMTLCSAAGSAARSPSFFEFTYVGMRIYNYTYKDPDNYAGIQAPVPFVYTHLYWSGRSQTNCLS
jgi:hypothetical protein